MTVQFISSPKFAIIPLGIDMSDVEYYDNIDEAKENALELSVDIHGKTVAILEWVDELDDYKIISEVCA